MSNTINSSNTGIAVRSSSTGIATQGGSIADRLAAQQTARDASKSSGAPAPVTTEAPVASAPTAQDDAMAELAMLRAQNAKLVADLAAKGARSTSALALKVSEKGGVSVYGTGRFPVTAYGFNAIRLFSPENVLAVRKLMAAEFGRLSFKTAEQRDTVVKALRADGLEVGDADIAAARLTATAE